jgi:hypothetical protein
MAKLSEKENESKFKYFVYPNLRPLSKIGLSAVPKFPITNKSVLY